ncbi:unnamed protein product, partial [Brassica oleracea]
RLGSSGSCHTAEEKLEKKRFTVEIVIYRRLSGGALSVHATSPRRSFE